MSNIKSFRNLLTNQTKNYKISPNNYPPSEKQNGLPPSHLDYFEDTSTSCSIDGIYTIKAQTQASGGEEVTSKNDSNNATLAGHLSKQFRGIFRFYNNCRNSQCLLTYLTPVACSFSVVIILASIAGPTAWIQTEERIPVSYINASYKTTYNISFVIKSSNASLWLLCTRQELDDNRTFVEPSKSCSHIDYFTTEEYQPDPTDSTNVLPYSITLSTPFLLFSFFILMISYILFLLAVCSQNYRIYYFIAGVCFIISGLLMLFGLIMFISIFKTEIGSKLRRSSLHGPLYSFKYGNGLILYVIGFITTELSGILNVFLFTKLQQMTQYNKNLVQLNNYVKMGNIDSDVPMNPCRRHPSNPLFGYPSINENGYIPNGRKCTIHTTNNLTKSLGNLYDHHQNHKHSHNVNFDFDEFKQTKSTQHLDAPLTRTVSTSTDIFDDGEGNKNNNQTKASSIKFTKDINASNNNKIELNNICGIMKSSNKSKENIFLKNSNTNSNNNSNSNNNNTSNGNCASNNSNNNNNNNCRVTTPKCKAKNIYYIEDTKEEDPPNIFIIDSHTLARHRRMKHYLHTNKSLDDFRTHKLNNSNGNGSYYDDHDVQDNNSWRYHYDDRNLYGSRTLPRDFLTRNHHNRPSLDNFFENYYNRRMSENFLDRRQNLSYPQPRELTVEDFYVPPVPHSHHKSFDELTSINVPKPPYQWPKTIPKSPSSYSAHSLHAHPTDEAPIVAPPLPFETDFTIDEFDLDKIEYERRKSHSNLFMDVASKKSFEESIGTAV